MLRSLNEIRQQGLLGWQIIVNQFDEVIARTNRGQGGLDMGLQSIVCRLRQFRIGLVLPFANEIGKFSALARRQGKQVIPCALVDMTRRANRNFLQVFQVSTADDADQALVSGVVLRQQNQMKRI